MKHILSAIIAACTAMLITSGIVAWATAAPEPGQVLPAAIPLPAALEDETSAHLDSVIALQLSQVRARLQNAERGSAQARAQ